MSNQRRLKANRTKRRDLQSPQEGTWMKFRVKLIPRSKLGLKNLHMFLNDGVHLTHVPNAKKPLQPGLRGIFMWPHLGQQLTATSGRARPITTLNFDILKRLAKRMIFIESANLERKASSGVLYPQHNHSMPYASVGPTVTARSVGRRIEQELDALSRHPQLAPNGTLWAQLSAPCRSHLANIPLFPKRAVRVGIIDSGLSEKVRARAFNQRPVVIQHFDENGRVTGNTFVDFDTQKETNGHGSACSVILAGEGFGVDPNCHLSVAAITKSLTEAAFSKALQWLVKDQSIEILSLSFATQADMGTVDGKVIKGGPIPDCAIRQCFERETVGRLFAFAAAGNFDRRNGNVGGLCGSPADSIHAFSVGALHVEGTARCKISPFSVVRQVGNEFVKNVPEFIAAGENVESLDKETRPLKSKYGGSTSHACPQVAGVASLILSRFPEGALTATDLTVLMEALGVRFPVSVIDHQDPPLMHNVSPIKLVSFR